MFEYHERDEVASGSGVITDLEEPFQVFQVAEMIRRLLLAGEGRLAEEISPVRLAAVLPGDVPAALALGEWRAMVHL